MPAAPPPPLQVDPESAVEEEVVVQPGAHASHSLRKAVHIVWCALCGRHAAHRLGVGLQRPCRGSATGVYPSRIAHLKAAKHPITAELI